MSSLLTIKARSSLHSGGLSLVEIVSLAVIIEGRVVDVEVVAVLVAQLTVFLCCRGKANATL